MYLIPKINKSKDVQKFLAAGEAAVKQSIDSLLITPGLNQIVVVCACLIVLYFFFVVLVQRLPRYVLFMKDIVKNTPENHVDFP